MKIDNCNIVAPTIFTNDSYSEAEVLGAMVLQWAKHDYYKEISVTSMLDLLIPIIKSKQFALFSKNNQPIGYVVWAFMDDITEGMYIQSGGEIDRFVGCNNGKNLWILSLFAESGCVSQITNMMRKYVFPKHCGKSLYHQGKKRGLRIMSFYGVDYPKTNFNK